ncbi:TetR family transcriptional regulator C-terminal domain-containing protein [Aeromicrobium sp. UC242_57]|uniref:TetR family transcriptional regulator C-terminal domain-containing protein n=1 Tax=Aeromicrobium sp. UC242_57 TaxID=3374624 RepID=UPI0037888D5A
MHGGARQHPCRADRRCCLGVLAGHRSRRPDRGLRRLGREGLGQPRWTALEVEFGAIARHSPYVATELVKRHREIREAIAQLVRQVTTQAGLGDAVDADKAATTLLSLGIGLGTLRSLDHTIDVGIFADTMRALLRGSAV